MIIRGPVTHSRGSRRVHWFKSWRNGIRSQAFESTRKCTVSDAAGYQTYEIHKLKTAKSCFNRNGLDHLPRIGCYCLFSHADNLGMVGEPLIYVYCWGNNPVRSRLKGRLCYRLAYGRLNSWLIEFLDTGERVVTDRRACRRADRERGPKRLD